LYITRFLTRAEHMPKKINPVYSCDPEIANGLGHERVSYI